MTRFRILVAWFMELRMLHVGVFLLGVAALVSSLGYAVFGYTSDARNTELNEQILALDKELYCRFRAGLPAEEAQAAYFRALGAGLVAVANEDDVALEAAAARGAMILSDLDRAIEAREHAVRDCVPKETRTP